MKMLLENESKFGLDQTTELIQQKVLSSGWRVSHVHDLKETLKKSDIDVLPVKVIEVCRPLYSSKLLTSDEYRIFSSLMPCRISVYEKSDGRVYISRMNAGEIAASSGGVVYEAMNGAFAEMEAILNDLLK